MNWWDDGDIDSFVVGDKDYDLGYPLRHHRQRDDRSRLVGRFQHDGHHVRALFATAASLATSSIEFASR